MADTGLKINMAGAYQVTQDRVEDFRKPNLKSIVLLRDEKDRVIMDLSIRCHAGGDGKGLPNPLKWDKTREGKSYQRPARGTVMLRVHIYDSDGRPKFRSFPLTEDVQYIPERAAWEFSNKWQRKIPPISRRAPWFHISRVNWEEQNDPLVQFFNALANNTNFEMGDEAAEKYHEEVEKNKGEARTPSETSGEDLEFAATQGLGEPVGDDEPMV